MHSQTSIDAVKSFLKHFFLLFCNGAPDMAWSMFYVSLEAALAFTDPPNREKVVKEIYAIVKRVGNDAYEDAYDYDQHYNSYLKGEKE